LLQRNMMEKPGSDFAPVELKTQTLPNGYKVTYRNDCELAVIYDDIFRKNVYFFEANTSEPFIVDCGGHIGLAVLYFKSLYPRAKILSFEPNPETFALLETNVSQNALRDVEAVNMALTPDGRKDAVLYVGENFLQAWDSTDTIEPDLWVNMHEYRAIPVPSTRLSSYINKRVDFLKLDIEGAELAVLDELNGKLSAVGALTLEYHQNPANLAQGKLQKIIEKLSRSAFRCEIFHEADSVHLHQLPTHPVYQLIIRATR
jgi:FkbM family methyltransferase